MTLAIPKASHAPWREVYLATVWLVCTSGLRGCIDTGCTPTMTHTSVVELGMTPYGNYGGVSLHSWPFNIKTFRVVGVRIDVCVCHCQRSLGVPGSPMEFRAVHHLSDGYYAMWLTCLSHAEHLDAYCVVIGPLGGGQTPDAGGGQCVHVWEVIFCLLSREIRVIAGYYIQHYCPAREYLYRHPLDYQEIKGRHLPARRSVIQDRRAHFRCASVK